MNLFLGRGEDCEVDRVDASANAGTNIIAIATVIVITHASIVGDANADSNANAHIPASSNANANSDGNVASDIHANAKREDICLFLAVRWGRRFAKGTQVTTHIINACILHA